MSEEQQRAETGPEGAGIQADPVATAMALGGASRDDAKAFLNDQRALIGDQRRMLHLQMEEMQEENPLRLSHLRIRRFGDYAKMALETSVGLLVLALVAGLSVMVWTAAHADGMIIESFSVPADLSARGLSGEVLASQVLDRLAVMQNGSLTARPARSYAGGWSDDIKVEIPDTGISVGEAYRFLRRWLGHETRISGEVWRTKDGLAITARVGSDGGATFTGPESALDDLVQKAADHLYRSTQPYRYGVYLLTHGRREEALSLVRDITRSGPATERAWGFNMMGVAMMGVSSERENAEQYETALRLNPHLVISQSNISNQNLSRGRYELALQGYDLAQEMLARYGAEVFPPEQVEGRRVGLRAFRDSLTGAFHDAAQARIILGATAGGVNSSSVELAIALTGEHDVATARAVLADPLPGTGQSTGFAALNMIRAHMVLDSEALDWRAVLAQGAAVAALEVTYPHLADYSLTLTDPPLAYAKARLGDVAGAEALIAPTPADCYTCLRMRARIAELQGQHGRADFWFARAIHVGPSIPMAYAQWGDTLLRRGKPDEAITQFKLANQKGPHFADPLEGWGEALMAKNQSHLALAKFKEAEKYAPNWGRLHLKWGEALVYAGKKDDAKAQFARAAQLDLTPSEKSELSQKGAPHA